MQGARPTPTCPISLSYHLPSPSRRPPPLRPRPFPVKLAPRSTHPLRTNSKPPPGASPFASYPIRWRATARIHARTGYQTSHARAIINVGRSQLRRFIVVTADLRGFAMKKKKRINVGRIGQWKDGDYSFHCLLVTRCRDEKLRRCSKHSSSPAGSLLRIPLHIRMQYTSRFKVDIFQVYFKMLCNFKLHLII